MTKHSSKAVSLRDLPPRTSTLSLTNATLPYALEIAGNGWQRAMAENPEIRMGPNMALGKITYKAVADVFGLPHTSTEDVVWK